MKAESIAGRGLPKCADGTLYHCVDGECSCPAPAYRDMANDVFGPGVWEGDPETYQQQADAVFGPGKWADPVQKQPAAPQEPQPQARVQPDARDAVRKLLQLRSRQQYERTFGTAAPSGSASSLGFNEQELLRRVREARAAGWSPYRG